MPDDDKALKRPRIENAIKEIPDTFWRNLALWIATETGAGFGEPDLCLQKVFVIKHSELEVEYKNVANENAGNSQMGRFWIRVPDVSKTDPENASPYARNRMFQIVCMVASHMHIGLGGVKPPEGEFSVFRQPIGAVFEERYESLIREWGGDPTPIPVVETNVRSDVKPRKSGAVGNSIKEAEEEIAEWRRRGDDDKVLWWENKLAELRKGK